MDVVYLLSVPDHPWSFGAKSRGTTYIEVQWTAPDGGRDSYEIRYKKQSETVYQEISPVDKDVTSYQIVGLEAGVSYDIGIRTISVTEQSEYTSTTLSTGNSFCWCIGMYFTIHDTGMAQVHIHLMSNNFRSCKCARNQV